MLLKCMKNSKKLEIEMATTKIKIIFMDVDGTLTDGKIHISENGELFKSFNIKDGMAVTLMKKNGIVPAIITGRESKIVALRCKELGIDEVYQGVENKMEVLSKVLEKYHLVKKEALYFGDDVNDICCMETCGLSACPADAAHEVKKIASYVCKKNGGEGALRELWENFITF